MTDINFIAVAATCSSKMFDLLNWNVLWADYFSWLLSLIYQPPTPPQKRAVWSQDLRYIPCDLTWAFPVCYQVWKGGSGDKNASSFCHDGDCNWMQHSFRSVALQIQICPDEHAPGSPLPRTTSMSHCKIQSTLQSRVMFAFFWPLLVYFPVLTKQLIHCKKTGYERLKVAPDGIIASLNFWRMIPLEPILERYRHLILQDRLQCWNLPYFV